MRFRSAIILFLAFALFVVVVVTVHSFAAPRVIGRALTPDGTEMCLVQEFNWSGEPFTTSFVYRRPGDVWRKFYYDHQDDYWRSSKVVLNTNSHTAVFYRGSSPAVSFDWVSRTYVLLRRRNSTNTIGDPMPEGWSPGRSVKTRN